MFIVFLRFSANRGKAGALMEDHNAWLKRGFDDGVFILAGSLKPAGGGAILAMAPAREVLEARLEEDPFVVEDVVSVEVYEIAPGFTDQRLSFLKSS